MRRISTSICLVLFLAFAVTASAVGAEEEKSDQRTGQGRRTVTLSPQVAERLILANDRLDAEKLDDALRIVDELLQRRRLEPPDLAQIHRFRGYIFVSKGMTTEAAAEFEKSLSHSALDESAERAMTYSLAQIYTQLDRFDRALELIDNWFATAQSPKPDAYFLKAMVLVQQENFEEALHPAKTAVEMSPQPRESWVQLLAAIYFQLQDFPNVATTLQRLIVMAPTTKRYWIQLATVQNYLGRDEEALATLRLAHEAKLLSEDRELRQLAKLLFARELPYECAKVLEDGLAAGVVVADTESYRLVASCYIAARENERAIEPLAKAGELAPDGESFLLLGQMHLQRDRFEPALEALGKALTKAKPEQRGSVHLLIGVAQLGSERYADAERAFRAALTDTKVHGVAESYLKYLDEQRVRQESQSPRMAAAS